METLSKENRFYFMGIAIIAVILHHLCYRLDTAWHVNTFPFTPFINGNIGVDVFFFASAYGCCASWERNTWKQYYLNRIRRIYPQCILFLIIVLFCFYSSSSFLHKAKVSVLYLTGLASINLFHTRIEWFIPSLLLVYFLIPVLRWILNIKKWYQVLMMAATVIVSWFLLDYEIIYWTFQCRIPVIMCGVFAYLNRDNKGFCLKMFTLTLMLAFCTREQMIINSMIIPLLMVSLSYVNLETLPFKRAFSWLGKHSLELFFAQTITTQFVMFRYFGGEKWLSLSVIIALTIVLLLVFLMWQSIYDRIERAMCQIL